MTDKQIEMETEILGKLNALAFFRCDKDFTMIDKTFPQYKEFIIQNKDRDFREVERELMNKLNNL